jgi:hypothetical protein
MTTNSVIDGTKLDLSKISFGKITRLPNGSKSVRISYDNGPFTIQTPMLAVPWGVNPPYSEKDNKKDKDDDDAPVQRGQEGKSKVSKWSMQMSFKGSEGKDKESQRVKKFLENMKAFDQLCLDEIVKRRQEWFDDDKKMSKETAEAIYDRLLRRSVKERVNKTTKESYPPCIEPKVNCVDGEFQCNCFTMNREKYDKPMDKLSLRGTVGEGIIRLTNFYIQQTSCGPTWTLMRLRADESAALSDFGFIDVDEEENENKASKTNVQIQDSDDSDDDEKTTKGDAEDDSDDDEEEEPEPEPVVQKGKAKAKTATTPTTPRTKKS